MKQKEQIALCVDREKFQCYIETLSFCMVLAGGVECFLPFVFCYGCHYPMLLDTAFLRYDLMRGTG